jgi:hypothetical protein
MPKTPARFNIPELFLKGCCDTSKNKHMHAHVQETDHPLIRSIEPGEGWIWCYPDEAFISASSPQLDERMLVTSR